MRHCTSRYKVSKPWYFCPWVSINILDLLCSAKSHLPSTNYWVPTMDNIDRHIKHDNIRVKMLELYEIWIYTMVMRLSPHMVLLQLTPQPSTISNVLPYFVRAFRLLSRKKPFQATLGRASLKCSLHVFFTCFSSPLKTRQSVNLNISRNSPCTILDFSVHV